MIMVAVVLVCNCFQTRPVVQFLWKRLDSQYIGYRQTSDFRRRHRKQPTQHHNIQQPTHQMRTDYYWPGFTILLLFNLIIKETNQFCLKMSGGKPSGRLFDVKACWSKAGIGTSIVLQQRSENKKGFKLVFDLGW